MRLKFEMWPHIPHGKPQNGYMTRFTDGKGRDTESWWSSPPMSIDHVGPEYLQQRHRNCLNARHDAFIKRRYKEEIVKYRME
ncbi:hypothetical protein [Paenibacillus cymbidii]|uniref:hypothetical protein n=1 Tax=Paenibacillus cymbidii TaxID=1639034 RepID=UPI001080D526|nr:hypothetical protein [Paenibacillus cymbidii]